MFIFRGSKKKKEKGQRSSGVIDQRDMGHVMERDESHITGYKRREDFLHGGAAFIM